MKQTMLLALPVLLCSFPVFAAPVLNSGDTAFMFITASLVLLMTLPGLALFYGGMAQSKNVLSVLTQVFSVTALTGVIFVLYGYSFSFTDGHSLNPVIGSGQKVFLRNITTDSLTGTVPEYVYVFFMLTFAAITPALITGAFAERIRFSSMLVLLLCGPLLTISRWHIWPGAAAGSLHCRYRILPGAMLYILIPG